MKKFFVVLGFLIAGPYGAQAQSLPSDITNYGGVSSTATGSLTGTSGSTSVTLAAAGDWATGQNILIPYGGPTSSLSAVQSANATPCGGGLSGCSATGGSTIYYFRIVPVDAGLGLGPATLVGTGALPNASSLNYTRLTWSAPATGTPSGYVIYAGTSSPSATSPVAYTVGTQYDYHGEGSVPAEYWLPATAPSAATAQMLVAKIVSGGGTTSLTLSTALSNSVSGQTVYHDNNTAISSALAAYSQATLPCGNYAIHPYGITLSSGQSMLGRERGCITLTTTSGSPYGNVVTAASNTRVSNITINHPFAQSISSGVYSCSGCSNFQLDTFYISKFWTFGVALANVSNFTIENGYINLNSLRTNYVQNQSILIACSSSNGAIFNTRSTGSAIDICGSGIRIYDNSIVGWGFGAGITTEQNPSSNAYIISRNYISNGPSNVDTNNTRGAGIEQWGPYSIISDNLIAGMPGDGIDSGGTRSMVGNNNLLPNVGTTSGHFIVRRCDGTTYNDSATNYGTNQTSGVANFTLGSHCSS